MKNECGLFWGIYLMVTFVYSLIYFIMTYGNEEWNTVEGTIVLSITLFVNPIMSITWIYKFIRINRFKKEVKRADEIKPEPSVIRICDLTKDIRIPDKIKDAIIGLYRFTDINKYESVKVNFKKNDIYIICFKNEYMYVYPLNSAKYKYDVYEISVCDKYYPSVTISSKFSCIKLTYTKISGFTIECKADCLLIRRYDDIIDDMYNFASDILHELNVLTDYTLY